MSLHLFWQQLLSVRNYPHYQQIQRNFSSGNDEDLITKKAACEELARQGEYGNENLLKPMSNDSNKSKDYWIAKEGEVLIEGYIALQAESHPIDFKNIEILNLCGCMDPKAKNYKSYFVKADNRLCIY